MNTIEKGKKAMMREISQKKSGSFKIIRIDPPTHGITDEIKVYDWISAVNIFKDRLIFERQGCTWQIICPDGQIGAEAQF